MKFSYFSNADNTYKNNSRSVEELLLQIGDQAVYAEELGHGRPG